MHVQMYDKKVSKKRQAEEAKQKRKDGQEQRKTAKEKQKKQGSGVRTRGGIRKRWQHSNSWWKEKLAGHTT